MIALFNEIFYRPIFNALVLLYEYLPGTDLGVAIIILTVLIRVVLLPVFYKGAKDQAIIQRLAPKMKEIETQHKGDQQKKLAAMLDLYREHKVNPLSPFLLLLIQLPVIIGLYQVFWKGISEESLKFLYSFVFAPEIVNHTFLGLVDLSSRSFLIVALAAIAQYFQGRLSLPKNTAPKKDLTPMEMMGKQMVYMGPIMTVLFLSYLPSAIGFYWLTTSVFSVIQQIVINKRLKVSDEKLIEIDKELHHKK